MIIKHTISSFPELSFFNDAVYKDPSNLLSTLPEQEVQHLFVDMVEQICHPVQKNAKKLLRETIEATPSGKLVPLILELQVSMFLWFSKLYD